MMLRAVLGVLVAIVLVGSSLSGCGDLQVGSELYWSARHEVGDFSEWTGVAGGAVETTNSNSVEITTVQAHGGTRAARLTIGGAVAGSQQNATLIRSGGLPLEAFYSAWYYLPQAVSVENFWVIMKFRARDSADDPSSVRELYDLDLTNSDTGEMSLRLFDHRRGGDVPLDMAMPVVPVGRWFHVEGFYRNAQDGTGRVTYWLDGRQLVDLRGQVTGPNPWVGWQACSVGLDLSPATAVLFVDDAAISRVRVGPSGVLSE